MKARGYKGRFVRILRKATCVGLAMLLSFSSIQIPSMAGELGIENAAQEVNFDIDSTNGDVEGSGINQDNEGYNYTGGATLSEEDEITKSQENENNSVLENENNSDLEDENLKDQSDEVNDIQGEKNESINEDEVEPGLDETDVFGIEDEIESSFGESSEIDLDDDVEDIFEYGEGILGDAVYIDEAGALVISTEGTALQDLSDEEILEIISEEMMYADDSSYAISMKFQFGQTEARSIFPMVNKLRRNKSTAWYWDSSNSKKLTFDNLENLTYDYDLEKVAMLRAAEIALRWSHTRPNGSSCFTAYSDLGYSRNAAAENIAAGYQTAEAAFTGWCETNEKYGGQGHRRAMLSSNYTCIGIGHVIFNGYNYWTQEFNSENHNSTTTTALDGSATVNTEIAKSQASNLSISLNKSSATINEGDLYVLPGGKISFQTRESWPSPVTVNSKLPELNWEIPEQYADYAILTTREDGAIAVQALEDGANGKEVNAIKLYARSGAISKTFTLNIKCVHSFAETVVPATLYSDGTVGSKCQRCGYTEATTTKRVDTISMSKSSAIWTGKDIRPTITVKNTAGKTVSSKYYSVTVETAGGKDVDDDSNGEPEGCIKPGVYKIIVSSVDSLEEENRYNFKKTLTFTINPKSITAKDVSAKVNTEAGKFVYVGNRISPEIILMDKGFAVGSDPETGAIQYYRLVEGQDYNVEYSSNESVGTATATIIGMGNYAGTRAVKYTINAATFTDDDILFVRSDDSPFGANDVKATNGTCLGYTYTGNLIKPSVYIRVLVPFGEKGLMTYTLTEGTDYTVSYKNNVSAYKYVKGDEKYSSKKTPMVVITGKGNFKTAGTLTYSFPIDVANLNDCSAENVYLPYTGKALKPTPVIYGLNGKALKSKTEYIIAGYCKIHDEDETKNAGEIDAFSYDLETEMTVPFESGKYVIICAGKGNFAGSKMAIPLTIAKQTEKPISKLKITVPSVSFPEKLPAKEKILVQDGKKIVRGFYYECSGDEANEDEISSNAISAYYLALANATAAAQSGSQEELDELEALEEVSFIYYAKNNDRAGTATIHFVAIDGKGYIGTAKKNYTINGIAMSKVKINNFKTSTVYDGTRKTQNFGSTTETSIVYLKYTQKGKEPVILNYDVEDPDYSDYIVTYSYPKGVNVGTVNVVIKGNPLKGYTGSIKKSFKVTAKKLDQKEIRKQETEIIIDGQAPFGSLKTMNYTGAVTTPRPVINYVPGGIAGLYVESDISSLPGALSLVAQEDYTISYENNIKRAAASDKKSPALTIKGKGNYTGTIKLTYNISSEEVDGSIFVSPRGSDPDNAKPGDGSLAKPYATLQAALNVANPGNVIYMRGGTYKGNTVIDADCSGNEADGDITIKNFPGEKVYLVGINKSDEAIVKFESGAHNITISGLNIGNYSSAWACGILMESDDSSEHGIHDINIENNNISKIKTTDTKKCGANAILLSGKGTFADGNNAINNIYISNNTIHDNVNGQNENISVAGNCKGIYIYGNKVYKNTNIGIDLYGNDDGEAYCQNSVLNHPRDCMISRNVVYSCKSKYANCAGIYVDGAYGDSVEEGIVITENEVYANQYGIEIGSEQWRDYYGEGVSGKDSSGNDHHVKYVSVYRNNIHDNPAGGIRIGGYTNSPEVTTEGTEPDTGWVVNCQIVSNYLTNNGAGRSGYNGEIHFSKCDSIYVSQNVITQGKNNKKYPVYGYDWGDDERSFDEKQWATNLSIE